MNADAGARKGRCAVRRCTCFAYAWSDGNGQPSCECGHPRRNHAQVWRPLVTTAGWSPEAA